LLFVVFWIIKKKGGGGKKIKQRILRFFFKKKRKKKGRRKEKKNKNMAALQRRATRPARYQAMLWNFIRNGNEEFFDMIDEIQDATERLHAAQVAFLMHYYDTEDRIDYIEETIRVPLVPTFRERYLQLYTYFIDRFGADFFIEKIDSEVAEQAGMRYTEPVEDLMDPYIAADKTQYLPLHVLNQNKETLYKMGRTSYIKSANFGRAALIRQALIQTKGDPQAAAKIVMASTRRKGTDLRYRSAPLKGKKTETDKKFKLAEGIDAKIWYVVNSNLPNDWAYYFDNTNAREPYFIFFFRTPGEVDIDKVIAGLQDDIVTIYSADDAVYKYFRGKGVDLPILKNPVPEVKQQVRVTQKEIDKLAKRISKDEKREQLKALKKNRTAARKAAPSRSSSYPSSSSSSSGPPSGMAPTAKYIYNVDWADRQMLTRNAPARDTYAKGVETVFLFQAPSTAVAEGMIQQLNGLAWDGQYEQEKYVIDPVQEMVNAEILASKYPWMISRVTPDGSDYDEEELWPAIELRAYGELTETVPSRRIKIDRTSDGRYTVTIPFNRDFVENLAESAPPEDFGAALQETERRWSGPMTKSANKTGPRNPFDVLEGDDDSLQGWDTEDE
jgi:hypothetical protein